MLLLYPIPNIVILKSMHIQTSLNRLNELFLFIHCYLCLAIIMKKKLFTTLRETDNLGESEGEEGWEKI